uniref:Uncharacterized protein n=1 Tax=Fagus sylvatica TaxID=28930 RepID=A0A2N9I3G3_FAGSY
MSLDETMREPRRLAMLRMTEQICRTLVATDLGLIWPRGTRPRPNRSHGTKAKSEKVHIKAKEMLDAAEVHYTCFELLSSACGLMKPRHGRDRARGAEKNQTEVEVAFDRPWMCRGGLQA